MGSALPSLSSLRKQLSLPVQTGYGWLKRKLVRHAIWDDDEFKRCFQRLQETQWWTKERLEELQLEQLRALVRHAYENVPYYRRLLGGCRLTPDDILCLDDLQKLPITTKEDIRNNLGDFIPRNIDRSRLRYETTGGSTSTPTSLYHDKYTVDSRERAFVIRQWNWAGYQRGDRIVEIRGSFVPRTSTKGQRVWWDYDTVDNKLLLSAFDMSEVNMRAYVEKIREFVPKFINATPSSLQILVQFMRRNQITGIGATAVFCESETLPLWLREMVEKEFGCKVFAGYGMTERVCDAVECECHEGYHVSMEYGILELVDGGKRPIAEPGRIGRVVGTGFDTYCMPLIRYAMDDLAAYASDKCSCGRQSVLIRDFKGRIQELVVLKSGQVVSIHAIIAGHAAVWRKIRELRFVQEREGELVAEIAIASTEAESNIARDFARDFAERLPENELDLRVVIVDKLPRTGRGKLPFLEQRLPVEFEDLDRARITTA